MFLLFSVVTIGESNDWIPDLVKRASQLKVGNGFDPETEVYVRLSLSQIARLIEVDDSR